MVIWQRVGMHSNERDEVVVSLTHYEIKDNVQFDVLANVHVSLGCTIQAECEVFRTCAYRRNER